MPAMQPGGAVTVAAPAKLNLYLHVTGRRADGFHLLDSLIVFADVHDTLVLAPADDWRLSVGGPMAAGLEDEPDNLVLRAGRGLADLLGDASLAADIRLIKRLPVAAGIGGGSSDAAAAIRGLLTLWGRPVPAGLMAMAATLGADVPVCLAGRAAWVGGIGEEMADAPDLHAPPVLLVNPGVAVPTPAVFRARTGPFGGEARFAPPADIAELAQALAGRRNDLTDAAVGLEPVIGRCLEAIANRPGVLLARMSGSGATCFGLFEDAAACRSAAAHLRAVEPGWWVAPTRLIDDASALPADAGA